MTTAERIAAIEKYLVVHAEAMAQMDRVAAVFGSMPEGPFQDAIYRLDTYAQEATSALIGDSMPGGTWLSWWLYDFPANSDNAATFGGREYQARTVPELVAIIEAWRQLDHEADPRAQLDACREAICQTALPCDAETDYSPEHSNCVVCDHRPLCAALAKGEVE